MRTFRKALYMDHMDFDGISTILMYVISTTNLRIIDQWSIISTHWPACKMVEITTSKVHNNVAPSKWQGDEGEKSDEDDKKDEIDHDNNGKG